MTFDKVLLLNTCRYKENVFPGRYGVPRPWYFFIQRSYWCGVSNSNKMDHYDDNDDENDDIDMEAEPKDIKCGISIKNISKIYRWFDNLTIMLIIKPFFLFTQLRM